MAVEVASSAVHFETDLAVDNASCSVAHTDTDMVLVAEHSTADTNDFDCSHSVDLLVVAAVVVVVVLVGCSVVFVAVVVVVDVDAVVDVVVAVDCIEELKQGKRSALDSVFRS